MDNRILVFLLTAGAVTLSVATGVMIGMEELIVPSIILLAFGAILLIATPSIATFLVVALYASGLTAPGLPGNIGLPQVINTAEIGLAILFVVFGRASIGKTSMQHWILLAFCLVVLMTGVVRGFGFRFLGSNLWGGTFYVDIFLCALLVFALPRVNMPARWWPVAVVAMGILAILPLLAELLYVKAGASFLALFVQLNPTGVSTMVAESETGGSLGRLMTAGLAVGFMVIAYLSVIHTSRLFTVRSIIPIAVLLGIFILSLVSGFRLITALIVLTIFLTALYQKTLTAPRVIFGIASSLILLGTLYYISDNLPLNMQRAISWLPGIHVSSMAQGDADQTVQWRLDVWHAAVQYIPEYFWIGKGLAFDGELLTSAMMGGAGWDPISWALIEGSYHNGYLSLLLLFGIFGLLTGLALLVSVLWRAIKFNSAPWKNPRLHRCYQAFLASITSTVIVYLTVYGDVTAIFPNFLFTWAVLESIRACDENSTGVAVMRSSAEVIEEEHAYVE